MRERGRRCVDDRGGDRIDDRGDDRGDDRVDDRGDGRGDDSEVADGCGGRYLYRRGNCRHGAWVDILHRCNRSVFCQ